MDGQFLMSILGTVMELAVFFIAFLFLLDIKKKQYGQMMLIFIGMNIFVLILNHTIPSYASFFYIFATLFSLRVFTKQNFFKVLFAYVLTMVEVMLSELMLIPTVGFLIQNDMMKTIIILLTVNIINLYVMTHFREQLRSLVEKYETKYINFMALNIFIYIFVYKIIWEYDSHIIVDNFEYFGFVMVLLMVVNYFIYKEVALISERTKVLMVQDEMRSTLDQMINDIRMKQHEYRNHLTTIQGFLDTNDPENAVGQTREYLDDIYSYDALDGELLNIDRNIIKAVLFMKRNEAHEKGLDFRFSIFASFKNVRILDYELSTILNNLLNNAFEAVSNQQDKRVELELGYDDELQQHYLQTKNSGKRVNPEHLSKLTDRNFTTKREEKGSHGFGLWNINNIVKKYKGLVYVFFEQDDIVFKVTFE
jgi:signal transduction histidine kinase